MIVGGDWPYLWNAALTNLIHFPYAWDSFLNNGLGVSSIGTLWISAYLSATSLFSTLGFSWSAITIIFWLLPSIIGSFFSAYILSKVFFKQHILVRVLSGIIYTANTYFLLVIGGGQLGVALAYAIAPFVLYRFIVLINNPKLYFSIAAGICGAIVLLFDPRIAYIIFLSILFYAAFVSLFEQKKNRETLFPFILKVVVLPLLIIFFLHVFWILPLLIFHQNPVQSFGAVYTSLDAIRFFSFATFENSISLLHPNWPENIFGKTYFMKPEFILLPVFAFASLFFVSKKNLKEGRHILFFSILAVIGAFLAKGANDPFGGIFVWMFGHVPGFIMFRDPTKWYTLVAISYSILIPFTIWKIYGFLKSRTQFSILNFQFLIKSKIFNLQNFFLTGFILYLFFLIRPVFLGQLDGILKPVKVSDDYTKLEQFLSSQQTFSRTFWVPAAQRFGFYSSLHPSVSARDFFKSVDNTQIINTLKTSESLLQESVIKYVIVPYDSQGEIFLKDRKYNTEIYQSTISDVKKIPYLKQVDGFGKIAVFEVDPPAAGIKDHFWSPAQNLNIKYKVINPTKYEVEIKNAQKGDLLIFSESYDRNWQAIMSSLRSSSGQARLKVKSLKFGERFNRFILPEDGSYSLEIYYRPQDWVNIGLVISSLTLISVITFLVWSYKKR